VLEEFGVYAGERIECLAAAAIARSFVLKEILSLNAPMTPNALERQITTLQDIDQEWS
jgi:hypothetical protein